MTLGASLAALQAGSAQCATLIVNAHRLDPAGAPLFSTPEREMITTAAFLGCFKLWEHFLEESIAKYLSGKRPIGGLYVRKRASPISEDAARAMLVGVMRFFDYANHENVRKIAGIYFDGGGPYEPHLSAVFTDLGDLRTMRNAAAHTSSATQATLEALAQRIFTTPQPNITLCDMLLRADPRSTTGETVFASYQAKLLATAELIARG